MKKLLILLIMLIGLCNIVCSYDFQLNNNSGEYNCSFTDYAAGNYSELILVRNATFINYYNTSYSYYSGDLMSYNISSTDLTDFGYNICSFSCIALTYDESESLLFGEEDTFCHVATTTTSTTTSTTTTTTTTAAPTTLVPPSSSFYSTSTTQANNQGTIPGLTGPTLPKGQGGLGNQSKMGDKVLGLSLQKFNFIWVYLIIGIIILTLSYFNKRFGLLMGAAMLDFAQFVGGWITLTISVLMFLNAIAAIYWFTEDE
jgi:hypothetical protein